MAITTGWVRVVGVSVVGFAVAYGVGKGLTTLRSTAPSDPYDAIPKGSFIAATIDVAELRRSPVYDSLFGEHGAAAPAKKMLGVGALADACGFDPTTRVQKVAIAVPEEDERGAFGVVARVEVTRQELETCTGALAAKRGGKSESHESGSFVVLDDKTIGGALAPKLAYGRGGLLVVGKGAWFDAMLGAADHTQPGLRDAKDHIALRTSLTAREGFRAPTALVTAVLPAVLRERLKREMSGEPDAAADPSNAAMAGVLGVNAVGLALHAGATGQNVDAAIELACDDEPACAAVETLVLAKRKEWAGELRLRLVGLGPLLDSIDVKREGTHVHLTASVAADALAATIDRVMKMRALERPAPQGGAADAPPARPRPRAHAPDEQLAVPRPDAGARP